MIETQQQLSSEVYLHYQQHLASFYSWMAEDFEHQVGAFTAFIFEQGLAPTLTRQALDLGAGHGPQSIGLARLGYSVKAVDFSSHLLAELDVRKAGLPIQTQEIDLHSLDQAYFRSQELVICWGDTLTHLRSTAAVEKLLMDCWHALMPGGHLVLNFRDYTTLPPEDQRIIPVKQDANRMLTCILDYQSNRVKVTDLLHECVGKRWEQRVSSYYKVRLRIEELQVILAACGYHRKHHQMSQGVHTWVLTRS